MYCMLIVLGRGAHPSWAQNIHQAVHFKKKKHQDGEGDGLVVVSHSIPILSPLFPIGVKFGHSPVFFASYSIHVFFNPRWKKQRWENPGFFNRKMMHHRVKKSWFSSGHPAPPLVISRTLQVATGMNCGVSGDDKSLDGVAVTQHDK